MRSGNSFAKKSLGQNFLEDRAVVEKILRAFDPKPDDIVLEIGPGRGALTEHLIGRVGQVYALEFDRDLAPLLKERFRGNQNFTLIEGDALKVDFRGIAPDSEKLRLIANLPYNISTAILQRLFACTGILEDCVLMFQREVVERITARPGTTERGYLTVMIEAHFSVERLFDIPPTAFRPVPKVWSSVVRCVPKFDIVFDHSKLDSLVSLSFSQKRKTILNNLKRNYANAEILLSKAGIDPQRRAETLTLDEWLTLTNASDTVVT